MHWWRGFIWCSQMEHVYLMWTGRGNSLREFTWCELLEWVHLMSARWMGSVHVNSLNVLIGCELIGEISEWELIESAHLISAKWVDSFAIDWISGPSCCGMIESVHFMWTDERIHLRWTDQRIHVMWIDWVSWFDVNWWTGFILRELIERFMWYEKIEWVPMIWTDETSSFCVNWLNKAIGYRLIERNQLMWKN
jgi:hypothetical protein